MLENTRYFFPFCSVVFFLLFAIAGKFRANEVIKIISVKPKNNLLTKWINRNYLGALIISIMDVILVFVCKFYPDANIAIAKFAFAQQEIISLIGFFIIKFSFAWLIVVTHEIMKYLEEKRETLLIKKVIIIELISFASIFLFTTGVTLIFANVSSLLVLTLNILLILSFLRSMKQIQNQN